MMKPDRKKLDQFLPLLKKYKLVLLVLLAGLLIMFWPEERKETYTAADLEEAAFDIEVLERRMEDVLSRIKGAGKVSVMLTIKSGGEKIYATDVEYREENGEVEENTTTVVISTGSGTEEVVVSSNLYPVFRGALIVCEGGADPEVRLLITQAVAALTGLGADKIAVCG